MDVDEGRAGSEEDVNVQWWEAVVEDGQRVPGPVTTLTVQR